MPKTFQEPYWEEFEEKGLPKSGMTLLFPRITEEEKEIFSQLKVEADNGSIEAQYSLGVCYRMGIGTFKSQEESFEYFKQAADQGHAEAAYSLGLCYKRGIVQQSPEKALYYFQRAADHGKSAAFTELGKLYLNGYGVQKSVGQALYYFQQGSNVDDMDANYQLALFYKDSPALAQNYKKKVFESYKRDAEDGNALSQAFLGECYEGGFGTEPSLDKAIEYFMLSANQNCSLGALNLGLCYLKGNGVEQSEEIAFSFFKQSFESEFIWKPNLLINALLKTKNYQSFAVVCLKTLIQSENPYGQDNFAHLHYQLAYCFEKGMGTKPSRNIALHYYQIAAQKGDLQALVRIGDAFWKGGLGITRSPEQGFHYYKIGEKIGIELGLSETKAYLIVLAKIGLCYTLGTGTELSKEKAFNYFNASAQVHSRQGISTTALKLGLHYEIGAPMEQSLEHARHFYKMASEIDLKNGFSYSTFRLAKCYENQHLWQQAFDTYKIAADLDIRRNCSNTIFHLAKCYEMGKGTEKSQELAFYYYKIAAEIDQNRYLAGEFCLPDASIHLAKYYEQGIGTDKNLEEACYYQTIAQEISRALSKIPKPDNLNQVRLAILQSCKHKYAIEKIEKSLEEAFYLYDQWVIS